MCVLNLFLKLMIQFQHGLMNLMKIMKFKKFKVNLKLNVFLERKNDKLWSYWWYYYKCLKKVFEKKFTVEVYKRVFNTVIQSMKNWFTNNKEILIKENLNTSY